MLTARSATVPGPAGRYPVISYVLAFLTAVANALSNVLNRQATRQEPAAVGFRLRLLADLAHRRTWLVAIALMVVSFLLGTAALGTGQLAAVQIVIIVELPLTLLGASRLLGSRLGIREWSAIAAMTAGVTGVLACLDPRAGAGGIAIPAGHWIAGSAASGGALVAAVGAARCCRSPARAARRAALLGSACGIGYGLASAYTKGMTQRFAADGIAGVVTSWQFYAAVVAGVAATWLLENAYHAGRLAAAQPGITLLDPLVATCWGVFVFGERVRHGPLLALAAGPVIAVIVGVIVLSRSPGLHAAAGTGEPHTGKKSWREPARR